jgi:hypothetical protein
LVSIGFLVQKPFLPSGVATKPENFAARRPRGRIAGPKQMVCEIDLDQSTGSSSGLAYKSHPRKVQEVSA